MEGHYKAVTVVAEGESMICHGVVKTKRRKEHEENMTRILIFLNVASTLVFNTKPMLTK